MKQMVLV